MQTFIVNRNTPEMALNQKKQIEEMSAKIEGLRNEVIIYNCTEEPFEGKLRGHAKAFEKYGKHCDYYWFNHPDLSFEKDMWALYKLLTVMANNKEIGLISPIHSTPFPNKYKRGKIFHYVASCDYLSLLIKGDIVKKLGFLNPAFQYCWGAIHEYTYKVYKCGYKVAYCDIASVEHFGGTTYGQKDTISREKYKEKAKMFANEYFIKKYGRNWDKVFSKYLPKGIFNTYKLHKIGYQRKTDKTVYLRNVFFLLGYLLQTKIIGSVDNFAKKTGIPVVMQMVYTTDGIAVRPILKLANE